MEKLKLWINDLFYACVDILIIISDVFGITYQEANVIIFCFIMPLIIIALFADNILLQIRINKLKNKQLWEWIYRV